MPDSDEHRDVHLGATILRTAFANYSPAERAAVLGFGVVTPIVLVLTGVYIFLTMGSQTNDLFFILPIFGVVSMIVILSDHAPQTISLHPAGVQTRRLWKRQTADARDVAFVVALHKKSRHAVMLAKRDNTAVVFGPGLSAQDFAHARAWATDLARTQGIRDEGDFEGAEAILRIRELTASYGLARQGARR